MGRFDQETKTKISWDTVRPYIILIAGGLLVRLVAVGITRGHPTDMNTFYAWGEMLFRDGFRAFYSPYVFTDYPPGYMYVLFLLSALRNFFGFDYGGLAHNILFKIPPILADVAAGVLLYHAASKHTAKTGKALGIGALGAAALYTFNPLTIMLSAVWGQVDSIFVFMVFLSMYLLIQRKDTPAYLIYAAAIMIKPQSLMFAPIYIVFAVIRFIEHKHSKETLNWLLSFFARCFMSLALMILISTPFGLNAVWRQFFDALSYYPFASVNAYNIYTMLGLNWRPDTETFLNITFAAWGIIAMTAAAIGGAVLLFLRRGEKWSVFYASAFICAIVFTFASGMHERYSFPIFLFLPAAYAFSGSRKTVFALAGLTFAAFLNYADALRLALNHFDYSLIDITSRVFSVFWMIAFGGFAVATIMNYREKQAPRDFKPTTPIPFTLSQNEPHRSFRGNYIPMIALTVIYTIVAFYRLGDTHAPENPWTPPFNGQAVFDLGEHVNGVSMWFFNGSTYGDFWISLSADGENFSPISWDGHPWRFHTGSVFRWNSHNIFWESDYRYVKITSMSHNLRIMEVWFRDSLGEILWSEVLTPDASNLAPADLTRLPPERPTFMNGTYFDEIFHPRTAYEFIHGLPVYEITHPPLGKAIIAGGVMIFGMNPFGWRFMGTFAGVLMVPIIYVFAHKLFKSNLPAFLTAAVFAFDFMHFVQTRLATIDSYLVLFIILQYYFMYKFFGLDFNSFNRGPIRKILLPLFLSGIFMGLGIATKWSGMYAGLGLAILFAISLWKRWKEYSFARSRQIKGYNNFWPRVRMMILCSFAFFVAIPLIIYVLSYIPQYAANADSLGAFFTAVWENQLLMFNYHGFLVAEHPYASPWWSWPIMLLPMWYYANMTAEGLRAGISGFGNPAVWWGGLAALVYTGYKYVKTRDKVALFLIIGYLAQFLPWMYVTRIVFIYHYFTAVPFLALMLGYVALNIENCEFALLGVRIKARWASVGFIAVTLLLFVLFYPVLTGTPVDFSFVDDFLRWLPGWVLA